MSWSQVSVSDLDCCRGFSQLVTYSTVCYRMFALLTGLQRCISYIRTA